MGSALEKRAGGSLKRLLGKLTTGKLAGFLTGLGVTSVIQSSSATTVMVAGFVWSDLLTDLERVADHCSNIACCVVEMSHSRMDLHVYQDGIKFASREFAGKYNEYAMKYALAE